MSTFKRKPKDKNFTIEIIDHNGNVRWLAAFPHKKASQELEKQIRDLVAMKRVGLDFDDKQVQFLERCSLRHLQNFVRWGLIPEKWTIGEKCFIDYIQDWFRNLSFSDTPKHAKENFDKVWRLTEECSWKRLQDINSVSFIKWREARQRGDESISAVNPRTGKKTNRQNKLSNKTLNYYLVAVTTFINWLILEERLRKNPLAKVEKLGDDPMPFRERTIFTPGELDRILSAAIASVEKLYGMPGKERAILYLISASTGLRWKEVKSLAKESLTLLEAPQTSTVTILAKDAKNGKDATLPLIPQLVDLLREHVKSLEPGQKLFQRGIREGKGAAMLREDMNKAGVPERDDRGRVRDFHALRHTYGTMLAKNGVPLPMVQKMMRHANPATTTKFYIHAEVNDMAEQLEKLPTFGVSVKKEKNQEGSENSDSKAG